MLTKNTVDAVRNSQISCQLPDESVAKIAKAGKHVSFKANEVIFAQGDHGDSVFLILEGRAKLTTLTVGDQDRFLDYISAGEHIGEAAVLSGKEHKATLTAVMDSELLELKKDQFNRLLAEVPGIAVNVSRVLSFRLRREHVKNNYNHVDRSICLVHQSPKTQAVAAKLANSLADGGEPIRVISDEVGLVKSFVNDDIEVVELPPKLPAEASLDWVKSELSKQKGHAGHTIISFSNREHLQSNPNRCELMSQYDQVLWLVEPGEEKSASDSLREFLMCRRALSEAVYWCWVMPEDMPPEQLPELPDVVEHRAFKLKLSTGRVSSRLEKMGLSHLVRHIRKIRLGLALGGGAARGMAHIGVLEAFEKEGIFFDVIAGTSAGALVAVPYAYGHEPRFLANAFSNDVRPGWLLKRIPKGKEWYLFKQFRFGKWDGLLRKHVGDVRLHQLLVPTYTVTADLILGKQVVRERGDAVHAILESINIPYISQPIFRQGMALVDGGIINNVPSDILPQAGADIVIGVDIAAQLNPTFAKNRPGMEREQMRRASQLQTILRASEVTSHEITTVRTRTVDQMITVDTSEFDFADFTRAPEMADAGLAAGEAAIPQFKRLVREHQEQIGKTAAERFVCHTCNK